MYIEGYYNKLNEIGFFYWIDHVYYKLLCLWSKYTDASDEYEAECYEDVRDLPPPEIVTREEWEARTPLSTDDEELPVPNSFIIFHDTKGDQCFTKEECCERVRQIQDMNMDKWKFSDIVYNFLVGGDGRIYEGRGWRRPGEHTDDWNHKSIGIAAIGDFRDEAPNEEMLEGIERFVNLGISNDNQYLTDTYTVLAHCQLDESNYWTECPGDAFLEEIRDMPHWEMAESYYESTCESSTYHSYNTSTYRNASDCTSESDYDYPKGYDEKLFGPWDKINFD
ncbi:peptidoglycan-recognition protein SB2-like [Macrosteles quadrilineatus]|uniref:peptidoglycan-recognition protein SB2-like n=1 Tax=Macrosteles quadrilineatus TaxID=74068 RepID=UPI0023E18F6C|nr:peptidoglycan-recognition protein SB2-like [Macrosteles quadrilineatus]